LSAISIAGGGEKLKNGFICKTASCKLCGEYSRKRGCISKHCPYLAERVAAGALNYKGATVDGGRDYLKRLTGAPSSEYTELSKWEE